MDDTEIKLKKEIEKWTDILETRLKTVINTEKGDDFLKNTKAYYKDSQHFFEQKDFIRSFEALLWSFSWLEIGLRYGFLKEN